MLRQAAPQTLARPLYTPPLFTTTAPSSEPRVPAPPPFKSVVLSGTGLPTPPMTIPAMSIQAAPVARPPPQVEPISSSPYPRVRPLPQRPPTAKPIEDENPWAELDDRPSRSNSAQANVYHSEFDSNALRRNRHIRRAQKAPLNGPRPLPPLPSTSISRILMEPYDETSKRVSSLTQHATPRIMTDLHRSKSDPTSPPLPRRPNLHLVIPKSQAANSDRRLPKQEPNPTPPSSWEVESSGSRTTKPQWHSIDYFPAIDYASMATPSASRRPPPSANPDGGKDNTTMLDWHLLEQALGIDSDVGVTRSASPVMESFLPLPGAPPVPAIPDRFLTDRA
jgi:hypothetical protein